MPNTTMFGHQAICPFHANTPRSKIHAGAMTTSVSALHRLRYPNRRIRFCRVFESLIYTGYFGFYLYQAQHPGVFLSWQQELHLFFGLVNTITLLTSSWSIARCVEAARAGQWRVALSSADLTATLAVVFVACKVAEWTLDNRAGTPAPATNSSSNTSS